MFAELQFEVFSAPTIYVKLDLEEFSFECAKTNQHHVLSWLWDTIRHTNNGTALETRHSSPDLLDIAGLNADTTLVVCNQLACIATGRI